MGAYNDDVLFVHIPKCGGWSCKTYMQEHLPGVLYPDTKRPEHLADSGLPIGHVPLKDIPRFTGRPLDSWQTIIAVVRNPYEQQLSQWQFWRNRYARGHRHPHDIWAAQSLDMTQWLQGPACDFHLWYEDRFHPDAEFQRRSGPVSHYSDFGGYYHYWITDEDGEIPPNVGLCQFENLEEEFSHAIRPYAIKPLGVFPGSNATRYDKDKWWHYYRHEKHEQLAVDLVEAKFTWSFAVGLYEKVNRKDPELVGAT